MRPGQIERSIWYVLAENMQERWPAATAIEYRLPSAAPLAIAWRFSFGTPLFVEYAANDDEQTPW